MPMKALRYYIFLLLALSGCEKQELPRIITAEISSINQTSAICGGYIISEGSSEVISKGICYSTSTDPTIQEDSITIDSGVRNFTTTLTGLELNTTYYVRAYATNSLGTSYGKTKSFTTDPPYLPDVRTNEVSSITKTGITCGGVITSDGAAQITDRGLCWGTSENPTMSDNFISAGTGSDPFLISITGLEPNTDYFIRAYATNTIGTGYGVYKLFSTQFEVDPDLPVDPCYPTTIYKLDPITLSQKRATYAERNRYMRTTLDEFGFCAVSGLVEAESPPFLGDISQDQAMDTVISFISENPSETGINNPDDINFRKSSKRILNDGSIEWDFDISDQQANNSTVLITEISIHVRNGEVRSCVGNWYPEIYFPASFNFDQEAAKSLLIGRVLEYYSSSGQYNFKIISLNDLSQSTVNLSVLPIYINDTIELHVAWQIHLDNMWYIIYIDVMTGEILRKNITVDLD